MSADPIILGHGSAGELTLDLERLIDTRMLLQANSGGGKTQTLRRLLEQTHPHVQHIVLDIEGDFFTLRERFDYVLARAGEEGRDCPVDPRSAHILARKLLELGVSAILDLYELKAGARHAFVRRFLEALIAAPRSLWHPVVVVIDEAHLFCPQRGNVESASAVIDLMTRGGKRGLCGVLATQRLSKLHKDAAAEANNKLIGRCGLDVDIQRASDELGLSTKAQQHRLRTLPAGHFFAFGPALSQTVVEVEVGPVTTTHLRGGRKATVSPSPPGERVAAVLAELAELPAEAAKEARTEDELRARVRDLEMHIAKLRAHEHLPSEDQLEKARARGLRDGQKQVDDLVAEGQRRALEIGGALERGVDLATHRKGLELLDALCQDLTRRTGEISESIAELADRAAQRILAVGTVLGRAVDVPALEKLQTSLRDLWIAEPPRIESVTRSEGRPGRHEADRPVVPPPSPTTPTARSVRPAGPRSGQARMLLVLAQLHPAGCTEAQWAMLAKLKRSGGTWQTYLSRLRSAKHIEESAGRFYATREGLEAAGEEIPPSPETPEEWLALWTDKPGMRQPVRLAEAVFAYGQMSRRALAQTVGLEVGGGTFQTYLSRCSTAGLLAIDGDTIGPGEYLRQPTRLVSRESIESTGFSAENLVVAGVLRRERR